jgi:hypothetical protein
MWGIDFTGIGVAVITLLSAAGLVAADEGKVGKLSANDTVDLCDAEDIFYGVIDKVDLGGEVSAVQRKGFKEVAFSGAAPVAGFVELVADGLGGVKAPAVAGTGRMYDVVRVDEAAGTLVLDLG